MHPHYSGTCARAVNHESKRILSINHVLFSRAMCRHLVGEIDGRRTQEQ